MGNPADVPTSRMRISRRHLWLGGSAIALALGASFGGYIWRREAPVYRIAFGSCARQNEPQPIWQPILNGKPDIFLFLGDTVYADTHDDTERRAAFAELGKNPGFMRLRETVPIAATWDDHDFGVNDAGADFVAKQQSKQTFLDFFDEPPNSDRRTRDGGIYTAYSLGRDGKRVQMILLDTRYHRSPWRSADGGSGLPGPYAPDSAPTAEMLGDEQWRWLEHRLSEPAELRIIATSIPFLMSYTGRETWANMPREKQRMLDLIASTGAGGVIFVSGDTHSAELSHDDASGPYPLWEVTSSALNQSRGSPVTNDNRVGEAYLQPNYGVIQVDWSAADPTVSLTVNNEKGEPVLQRSLPLASLHRKPSAAVKPRHTEPIEASVASRAQSKRRPA